MKFDGNPHVKLFPRWVCLHTCGNVCLCADVCVFVITFVNMHVLLLPLLVTSGRCSGTQTPLCCSCKLILSSGTSSFSLPVCCLTKMNTAVHLSWHCMARHNQNAHLIFHLKGKPLQWCGLVEVEIVVACYLLLYTLEWMSIARGTDPSPCAMWPW